MPLPNARDLTTPNGPFWTPSSPNHLAAATAEGVRGKTGAVFSTASFGFSVLALPGRTCLNGTPRIKPAIDGFNSWCARASCVESLKAWLKI
jgi:hypothetical protein